MRNSRTNALLVAATLFALGGAASALAQSGVQYTIVQASFGDVVTQISGNGISLDMTALGETQTGTPTRADVPAGTNIYVTCSNNAAYNDSGCVGGAAVFSAYVTTATWTASTVPSRTARTPSGACPRGWWPTYYNNAWQCALMGKSGARTKIRL